MAVLAAEDLRALEAAAWRAWPALNTETLEGWCLRQAEGYTKRANSANATAEAAPLDAPVLAAIEQRYAARGLPVVFRLASFEPAAVDADARLDARGYRRVDETLVMTAELDGPAPAGAPGSAAVHALPDIAAWLDAYQALTGAIGPGQRTHLSMLQAIRSPAAFGVDDPASPACCGLGVRDGGHALVGLFDIATQAASRGQGRATRLCAGLMAWGRAQGARRAYLQVMVANDAARRVYERLGFVEAYRYAYRVAG